MTVVHNVKDLVNAILNGEIEIEIKGPIKNVVIKIKATGVVAWGVAIGAIGIAAAAVIASPATGGVSGVVGGTAAFAATAAALGGTSIATAAIGIAVAGGGVSVLNKLREYDIKEQGTEHVILRKKSSS
ncbi:MAG: adhesin [Anaerovibrio sp.]|nr:adhesin [Anaerovibrio sp.]